MLKHFNGYRIYFLKADDDYSSSWEATGFHKTKAEARKAKADLENRNDFLRAVVVRQYEVEL